VKKLLAGCLIVLVVAIVGFTAAGYYAFRWAQPMIQGTADYLDRARELSRLGDRVSNKSRYVPPADGELSQAQVDRFLAVQARVRDELGARWAEIEAKSAEIREKTGGSASADGVRRDRRELTFSEFTAVFSDLAGIYMDARREQVNALNVHKFSDEEYRWVRLRVYEAAGMEITSGIDVSKLEQLARDNGISASLRIDLEKAKPEVPAANIKLVRAHLARIKESFHIAILGL
jgi:hypothetical protein